MKTYLKIILIVYFLSVTMSFMYGQTFELGSISPDSTLSLNVISNTKDIEKSSLYEVTLTPNVSIMNTKEVNASSSVNVMASGYGNIHPHIANQFGINTGLVVGDIPIHHQVGYNGTTTYTIPIESEPGQNNFGPLVSLVYNNMAGNSILGQGWSVGGLSSINRTISKFFYNGSAKPTEMTADAKFVLDGLRLSQKSATSTVRTFTSEQGLLKIEAFMSGNVTKYFKVWFPNGNVGIYGVEYNTANKLSYPLTKMTDIFGNTINYAYTEIGNNYYIFQIFYKSTAANTSASITFEYKTRDDTSKEYDAGLEVVTDRLITTISCKNNNTVIRKYSLSYGSGKRSLLTQVDCNLTSGNLNPLKFYYGTSNPQTKFEKKSAQLTEWFNNATVPNLVLNKGKFDMWSNDDAVLSYPALNPYYESGSTINSLYNPDQKLLVYSGMNDDLILTAGITAGSGFIEMTSGDIDGKPGDEIIKINNTVSGSTEYLTFTLYKAYSLGYSYSTRQYTQPAVRYLLKPYFAVPKAFCVGDFAGLGRMQVVGVTRYNPLNVSRPTQIVVYDLSNGATLCNTTCSDFAFKANNTSSDIIFGMDYDGDGRTEICHIHENGTDIYSFSGTSSMTLTKIASITDIRRGWITSRKLMVGDINGDGKTDLVLSPYASYYNNYYSYVPVTNHKYCPHCGNSNPGSDYCNSCHNYLPPSQYCYECGNTLSYGYCNNSYDYKPCCPSHGSEVYTYITEYIDHGDEWNIYYSKGSGGFDKKTQKLFNHQQTYSGKYDQYALQDINDDGMYDLIRFNSGSISAYTATGNGFSTSAESAYTYASSSAYLIPGTVATKNNYSSFFTINNGEFCTFTFTRNDARERMISAAVNSLGVVFKSDYRKLNDRSNPTIYERSTNANFPYENYEGPLWVTSVNQLYHNGTQFEDNRYKYSNAILHRQGHGFRGFTTFSVTDNRNRTKKLTFAPFNYSTIIKEETPETSSTTDYFVQSVNWTVIAVPTKRVVTDLLNNNVITTKYTYYDSYWNPGKVETDYGAGNVSTQDYVYSNTDNSNSYVLGIVKEVKNTTTRSGSSWIDKTVLTHNSYWQPLTKTVYTGASGSLLSAQETYVYDSYGNLTNQKVKPYSSTKPFETKYVYNTTRKLLTKITNYKGISVTYGYDDLGRMNSTIDHLNKTTSYSYDAANRITGSIAPNGITSSNVFSWNTSNNGSVVAITSSATKSPSKINYIDVFGRPVRKSVVGFNGTYIHTDFLYDDYGRLKNKSEPYSSSPRYISYEYDSYDRPTKIKLPSNRETTVSYTSNMVTTIDAGLKTTKKIDATGALLESSDPAGIISYKIRPDGQIENIKAPDGKYSYFEYDNYGRKIKITDPSAGEVQYQYNDEGLLYRSVNARTQVTEYEYNDYGQLLKVIYPDETVIYSYRTIDNKIEKVTAGTHYELNYVYDDLGRVSKESEKQENVTFVKDYKYEAGRISSVKYNNVVTDELVYNYNSYGYLSNLKFGTKTIYTVNSRNHLGQLTQYTQGNGVVTNRTYSVNGTPATIKAGSSIVNLSYTFDDPVGLLLKRNDIANGSGEETFLYDGFRRLTNYGNTSKVYNTVGYSSMGNITNKSDAGSYTYNVPNKPYAIGQQSIIAPQTMQVRYIRDAINGSTTNASNHWVEIQALNSSGTNLALGKSITASGVSNANLITDGNTASDPYADGGSGLKSVTVDLGQAYAVSDVKVWHYYKNARSYKASKTEISANGTNWTTLHDAATDGIYKESPLGRTYSLNTSTPTDRSRYVDYLSSGRPEWISYKDLYANFQYNHNGARTYMRLSHNVNQTKTFVSEIHYLGGNYERELRGYTLIERLYLGGTPYDAPAVAIRTDGGAWIMHYTHRDYLGSIVAVSDASGNAVEKRSYDAWGRLRNPQTLKPYGPGEQPTLLLGRGFTGHEHLPEFGLVNMNARLYDPVIGRFLSPDPYVQDPLFSQFFNRYTYGFNNPLVYVDEDGEIVWFVIAGVLIVKAAINVYQNWDYIKAGGGGWDSWGRGLKFAGIGAVDGLITLYCPYGGSVLGPTVGSTLNTAVRGGSLEDVASSFATNLVFNMAGDAVGRGVGMLASKGLTSLNITQPLVQKIIPSVAKNVTGDIVKNTGTKMVQGGQSFPDAFKSSLNIKYLAGSSLNGILQGSIEYYYENKSNKARSDTSPDGSNSDKRSASTLPEVAGNPLDDLTPLTPIESGILEPPTNIIEIHYDLPRPTVFPPGFKYDPKLPLIIHGFDDVHGDWWKIIY